MNTDLFRQELIDAISILETYGFSSAQITIEPAHWRVSTENTIMTAMFDLELGGCYRSGYFRQPNVDAGLVSLLVFNCVS
jgi:hypothetical protein